MGVLVWRTQDHQSRHHRPVLNIRNPRNVHRIYSHVRSCVSFVVVPGQRIQGSDSEIGSVSKLPRTCILIWSYTSLWLQAPYERVDNLPNLLSIDNGINIYDKLLGGYHSSILHGITIRIGIRKWRKTNRIPAPLVGFGHGSCFLMLVNKIIKFYFFDNNLLHQSSWYL